MVISILISVVKHDTNISWKTVHLSVIYYISKLWRPNLNKYIYNKWYCKRSKLCFSCICYLFVVWVPLFLFLIGYKDKNIRTHQLCRLDLRKEYSFISNTHKPWKLNVYKILGKSEIMVRRRPMKDGQDTCYAKY